MCHPEAHPERIVWLIVDPPHVNDAMAEVPAWSTITKAIQRRIGRRWSRHHDAPIHSAATAITVQNTGGGNAHAAVLLILMDLMVLRTALGKPSYDR